MRWMGWIIAAGFLIACIDPMSLPSVDNIPKQLGVGDTTYLQVTPAWGAERGLSAPVEISISHAGQLFVADTAEHAIRVFDQSGKRLDDSDPVFETLDLSGLGAGFAPVDVDIDGRLNVLFTDGGTKIYRWNQYWNIIEIVGLVSKYVFFDAASGTTIGMHYGDPRLPDYLHSSSWQLVSDSLVVDTSAAIIDSLVRPHVLFDITSPENTARDIYFGGQADSTHFSALSAARNSDDFFYAADSFRNRLVQVELRRNGILVFDAGDGLSAIFTHYGRFRANVVQNGTGAGTMNLPTGVDVDQFGNIYYSQLGEFMYVHSVQPSSDVLFSNVFQLDEHEIMDSTRYRSPYDVAVDQNQMIYIANTGMQEILVFDGDGEFFRKAGIVKTFIDTSYFVERGLDSTYLDTSIVLPGDTVATDTAWWVFYPRQVMVDTFYVAELKGELLEPVSVEVDERGIIYVCDPAQGKILRYTLSTNLDEDFLPEDL